MNAPSVVFTDGDEAIRASILSLDDSTERFHFTCTFHLFDMNVKKRIQPVVTKNGAISGWAVFRKGLELCKTFATEVQLTSLWNDLMGKWLPESGVTQKNRKYMNYYV